MLKTSIYILLKTIKEINLKIKTNQKPNWRPVRRHRHKFNLPNDLPNRVDWRLKNAVTPIKEQGDCSASYVFAAIASLEGCWADVHKELKVLSEQNVIDCLRAESVCKEGTFDDVYDYISRHNGLNTNDTYPYTGQVGICKHDFNHIGATIRSWVDDQVGCEEEMKNAVAHWGPVAAGIDSSS